MDFHATLGIGASRCANGKTWEFYLTFDNKRLWDADARSVFLTPRRQDNIAETATIALRKLLERTL